MGEPFIGEIRIFPNDYIPDGWLPCDGRALSVNEFQALFAVIGTAFGGDGRRTFMLPNLAGRVAAGPGAAAVGSTDFKLGKSYGEETATLTTASMPAHRHQFEKKNTTGGNAGKTSSPGPSSDFGGLSTATGTTTFIAFSDATKADTSVDSRTLGDAGGSAAHENRQPYLAVYHAIAHTGDFPVRDD